MGGQPRAEPARPLLTFGLRDKCEALVGLMVDTRRDLSRYCIENQLGGVMVEWGAIAVAI